MKYKTKENRHKLIAKLVGDNKGCLDIGYGQHPNLFLKEAVGVDIQENKVPNYKEIFVINLNFQTLPFKNNSFKIVIANDIIEHIENPSFLLREINRVLKDNGKLIISTPNAHYYWWILRNLFLYFIRDMDEGQHLSNWGILDFIRLLKLNGFKVRKIYGSHFSIPFINPIKFKRKDITISSIPFPRLSYLVLYDCIKISKPENKIYTREPMQDYSDNPDGSWINKINEAVK